MNLDVRTVIVLLISVSVLLGASLLVVARGYFGQVQGVSRWAAATLLQALGWTLYGPARGLLPEIIPIILGNGLICLSLAMYLLILAEFGRRVLKPSIPYGLVALQSGALALLVLAGADVSSRIAVVAMFATILTAMSSHVLLGGTSPRPVSHTLTGAMFGASAAFGAARTLQHLILWSTDRNLTLFAPDLITDLSFTAFFMTGVMFNFGFLLMVSDRHEGERNLAEGRLRESEQRFKAIIEKDFDSKRSRSLGLQLASDLARQLGGALQVGPPPAAAFTVIFPA